MGIPDDGARWSGIVRVDDVGSREEVDDVISLARANGQHAQVLRHLRLRQAELAHEVVHRPIVCSRWRSS